MLRPAFTGGNKAFEAAFKALSDQEWMCYDRDPDTDEIMLCVDENLHPQLLEYFARAAPEALDAARGRLAPLLASRLSDPLRGLGLAPINAALSLLPDREAAKLWSEVEARIAPQQYGWDSAQRLMLFLLGAESGAAGGAPSLLQAAVQASQAAVSLQQSLVYNSTDDWDVVGRTLAQVDPVEAASPIGQWLSQRVLLGKIAAGRVTGQPPTQEQFDRFREITFNVVGGYPPELGSLQQEQRLAAFLSAAEALLDRAEKTGERPEVHPLNLRFLADRQKDESLRAFSLALSARSALLSGEPQAADESFAQAEEVASGSEARWWCQPKPWVDWRAPDSLRDRLRLEWLRLLPQTADRDRLSRWLDEATAPATRAAQIDSERLLSAILGRMLDVGVVQSRPLLEQLEKLARYEPKRHPFRAAHSETPPLIVTVARGWLALGDTRRATDGLESQSKMGTQAVDLTGAVAASLRGLVTVARRMRQQQQAKNLRDRVGNARLPDEEVWQAAVLSGALPPEKLPAPDLSWPAERLHAWWSSQYDLTPERLEQAQTIAEKLRQDLDRFPEGQELYARLALALDAEERAIVAGERERWALSEASHPYAWFLWIVKRYPRQLSRPEMERALRLFLRAIAISADCFTLVYGRPELVNLLADPAPLSPKSLEPEDLLRALDVNVVGVRRAAEIALEEGELLALRLPKQGLLLLFQALEWFGKANDAVGVVQAGTLAAGAANRVGDRRMAGTALEEVKGKYEQLRLEGQVPDLVKWSEIPYADLDILDKPEWRGWLVRLHVCLLPELVLQPDARPVDYARTREWLARLTDKATVPELRLYAEDLPSEGEAEWKVVLEKEGPANWQWALLGAGFLLLLGLFYFVFKGAVQGIIGGVGPGLSIVLYLVLLLLLVAAGFASPALRDRARAWSASRMDVRLKITPSQTGLRRADLHARESIHVSIELQQGPRWELRLWPPPFVYRPEVQTTSRLSEASLLRPYAWSAQGLDQELGKDLGALKKLLRARSVPVRLHVDDALVPYPWEALLSLAVPAGVPGQWKEPLRYYRTGGPPLSGPRGWPGDVRVVSSETWADLFEPAWQAAKPGAAIRPGLDGLQEMGPVRVLHLVGRPIQTQAGLLLQVGTGGLEKTSSVQQEPVGRGGLLVAAEDLPREHAWLVVVQGIPVDGMARGEADREDAAYLRAIAADMLRVGSQAVVVLPAMPPALVRKVLARLGRGLRGKHPPSLRQMLEVVTGVRAEIMDWRYDAYNSGTQTGQERSSDVVNAVLAELALDVCLYWQSTRTAV
jgi:hypothetical protein